MSIVSFSQKEYYQKNKERLSIRRKRKYKNDLSYREGIRRKSRNYSRMRRERSSGKKGVVSSSKGTFITIGRLSKIIGKGISTIRAYHRKGILPNPIYFDTRGWRLYTLNQAILLRKAFKSFDQGTIGLRGILLFVEKEWNDEVKKGEK